MHAGIRCCLLATASNSCILYRPRFKFFPFRAGQLSDHLWFHVVKHYKSELLSGVNLDTVWFTYLCRERWPGNVKLCLFKSNRNQIPYWNLIPVLFKFEPLCHVHVHVHVPIGDKWQLPRVDARNIIATCMAMGNWASCSYHHVHIYVVYST
jgi:hypothetical protein